MRNWGTEKLSNLPKSLGLGNHVLNTHLIPNSVLFIYLHVLVPKYFVCSTCSVIEQMQELFRSWFQSKWVSAISPQGDNWQNWYKWLLVSSFPIRSCLLRLTPQASFQIILLLCAHKLEPTIIKGWLSPPEQSIWLV